MSLEQSLQNRATTDSTISSLVSTRVYPEAAPQAATLPYVVYSRVSTIRYPHITGPSGVVAARMQFDVIAATYAAAKPIADAIRLRFDGYRGTMGTSPNTTVVRNVTLENEMDGLAVPVSGNAPDKYRVILDFMFTYNETTF